MTTQLTPTTERFTNHVGLPPPRPLDLIDGDRVVGWIAGTSIGFRGFANEVEAAQAAWIGYRTLTRRLERRRGTSPIPVVDNAPLALERRGDEEMILAGEVPIGRLVRPGAESPSGPDYFGFELDVPPPAPELSVRAKAHLIYRTLRISGTSWALWHTGNEGLAT